MPERRQSLLSIRTFSGLQGIIDALNKIQKAINNTASYLFADNETPAGLLNDSNKVFTLAFNPDPNLSLELYLNGVYQTPGGEDYDLSGITITFVAAHYAPVPTDILRAFYRHK